MPKCVVTTLGHWLPNPANVLYMHGSHMGMIHINMNNYAHYFTSILYRDYYVEKQGLIKY